MTTEPSPIEEPEEEAEIRQIPEPEPPDEEETEETQDTDPRTASAFACPNRYCPAEGADKPGACTQCGTLLVDTE